MVSEMTYCLDKIDKQRDHMKEIASDAAESFDIPKKLVNRMARIMFKQAYADLCAENEHFELLYETVIENKKVATV
jgi:radical SAM superfamily enzyme